MADWTQFNIRVLTLFEAMGLIYSNEICPDCIKALSQREESRVLTEAEWKAQ